MQITQEELLAQAQALALENRILAGRLAVAEAECSRLRELLAAEAPDGEQEEPHA